MNSYLVLLFVLGITFNYGCAQINDESTDSRNKEQNSEKIQNPLQEIAPEVTVDDDAVIETVELGGTKVDKDEAAENSDKLLKDLESKFTATLLQFFDRDDLYKDARFRAIMNSLKTAIYTITGSVNHDYIQNIVEMVQKWDDEKRRHQDHLILVSGNDIYKQRQRKEAKNTEESNYENNLRRHFLEWVQKWNKKYDFMFAIIYYLQFKF
ncbi:uncharacterized protein TNCT_69891 [Trichonephila clavata]|uniref:Uncharacterized protein n=1 Tax=Trichonephila clavata TaxID=2740835 RepID=A0A8X6KY49_TRICU|nr:uncharacterized protein TNCT_69891 [Trichonephila clavata]